MPEHRPRLPTLIALLLLAVSTTVAADPCTRFKWDVSQEVALFAGEAAPGVAGSEAGTAPLLQTGRLYELTLTPQKDVSFAVPLGKTMVADGAHAGLARFEVETAGQYRIALDAGFWVDIVSGGKTIDSADFNGVPGCTTPRKVVLYELPADQELTLQLGKAVPPKVRVTVTAVD